MSDHRPEELLIDVLAGMLEGLDHVAVGAASPIPGAAALLARERSGGAMRVSVLGSARHNPFTDGGRELFDCAAQGRIDAFFLGGGEIDGAGNINLVGIGGYPESRVRWPGSFGSAYLYFLVPRVILFREEHTPRVLVPRVEFVSAPGTSPEGVYRPADRTLWSPAAARSASIAPVHASRCRACIPVTPWMRSWPIPASRSRCRATSPRRRRLRRRPST